MPWCMRTTLTLEDDVAALLKRAMKARKASLKQVVNDALRTGLTAPAEAAREEAPYRTPVHDGGRLLMDVECIGRVMAVLDGEEPE